MHPLAKKHFKKILKKLKISGLNKNCNYYPCHSKLEDCTWCYCPFYPCEDETLGGYIKRKGEKIWSCENCAWIHHKNVAQEVLNKIKWLGIEKPKEIEKNHQKLIQIKKELENTNLKIKKYKRFK